MTEASNLLRAILTESIHKIVFQSMLHFSYKLIYLIGEGECGKRVLKH